MSDPQWTNHVSDPQWTNYQPHDPESEQERTLTVSTPGHPDNALSGRAYVAALVAGGLLAAVVIWYAGGDERGGDSADQADPVDTSALQGDVLADALVEAEESGEGDPYALQITETTLWLSYFDAGSGERLDLRIDLDGTPDTRRDTDFDFDVEPGFDPTTFPLDEVDADVLRELTEQAIADADEPTGFDIDIEVPDRADGAVIDMEVYGPDESARLTADLDGSNVSIE